MAFLSVVYQARGACLRPQSQPANMIRFRQIFKSWGCSIYTVSVNSPFRNALCTSICLKPNPFMTAIDKTPHVPQKYHAAPQRPVMTPWFELVLLSPESLYLYHSTQRVKSLSDFRCSMMAISLTQAFTAWRQSVIDRLPCWIKVSSSFNCMALVITQVAYRVFSFFQAS